MGSAWRKAKVALGLNLCVHVPLTADDDESGENTSRLSESAASSGLGAGYQAVKPSTPTPTSLGLKTSKSGSRSSKRTCAICLGAMRAGQGHALFTAECSHTFHFNCIASNVKHGNRVCPICRAKWKEIPNQLPPSSEPPRGRSRVNPVNSNQDNGSMIFPRRMPRADSSNRQHHHLNLFHASEPSIYDDDEPVDFQSETVEEIQQGGCMNVLDIETYPEFSAVRKSDSEEDFAVLVHLKAPHTGKITTPSGSLHSTTSRAPVDLVTVLVISGSMAGTKLALLKRAMGFVIQNLGPSDRLSVVAFSSTARRLFHLRRMSETGRQQALLSVNSLLANGGTNIGEGLRKGAKVIQERREKNPVCGMILLSDGQDTYASSADYQSVLPSSIQIPVHAFGFGADHDSAMMHTVSETSGGTFSFIETEGVIQDAFAQCIGGLLSVVVQELRVNVECVHPGVRLAPIKSGSYASRVVENGRAGSIDVGDLYADEERDFLVSVNVPAVSIEEITLLKVSCSYKDPVSKEPISTRGERLRIQRPDSVEARSVSIEVDRERNRVKAAEAMGEARAAAERRSLSDAVSILETCRRFISASLAGRTGDRLCVALDAELKEMQERMASRQRYETSGRAYVLSGLSSHSWQRATARGDSTDSGSLVHAYQTPLMVDMVTRSQIFSPLASGPRPPTPRIRLTKSAKSLSLPLVRPK